MGCKFTYVRNGHCTANYREISVVRKRNYSIILLYLEIVDQKESYYTFVKLSLVRNCGTIATSVLYSHLILQIF